MAFGGVGKRGVRITVALGLVGLAGSLVSATEAEARRGPNKKRGPAIVRNAYAPPFSSIVVDANTGRTLQATDADELRHPASVTKVMTLFMLFEQLERGALSLDSELRVSRNAAAMAPSKLGLRPGETISVEDAIKALVTKSANDAAATIAENLAGSEEEFAERMTKKARSLGMSSTVYRNASGLPDREQVTTARDLAILGRAIQERFPRYYRYFQTRSFAYNGRVIGNHNRLLGRIEGVDGIKTGFTNASGFNLLTSARIDGRHVVGVVLGGRSGASRDNIMAKLITTQLARASVGGSHSVLAEAEDRRPRAADVETTAATTPARPVGRPLDLNPVRPAVASASNAAATATPPARLAFASAAPGLPETGRAAPVPPPLGQKIEARLPASAAAPATIAPPEPPARAEFASAKLEPVRAESRADAEPRREAARPVQVSPWVIQLAAEENEGKARDVLDQAKSRSGRLLSRAAPFTEKVVRGGSTLYRARFSGFSEADDAQEACKTLKRSGFACFATRS